MSAKSESKTKHSRRNEGGAAAPAAKRQKTTETTAETHRSVLLQAPPEILRKVYSFLSLKEALLLRQVHRQFNELRNVLYQYSIIMNEDALKRQGFIDDNTIDNYLHCQTEELCNLVDNERLRAVLRNESLPSDFARIYVRCLIGVSKTDNGQAVSILLEDERCNVDVHDLENCLKNDCTVMAEVLQQDERVKKDIQMCRTCSSNIGCYECTNAYKCAVDGEPRYCRECVLKDDRFCGQCNEYLCPGCHEEGDFERCEKCNAIVCIYGDCRRRVFSCV